MKSWKAVRFGTPEEALRIQELDIPVPGWRVWRRRAHYRACGYPTHSERRRLEHIRLSRDRISDRHSYNWIVYAESARRLEA